MGQGAVARPRAAEQGLAEVVDWSSGPEFVLSHSYILLIEQEWERQLLVTGALLVRITSENFSDLSALRAVVPCGQLSFSDGPGPWCGASLLMGRAALSICLSVYPFVYLFVCLPICLFTCCFICLSKSSFTCVGPSIQPPVSPIIHLSTIYLCAHLYFPHFYFSSHSTKYLQWVTENSHHNKNKQTHTQRIRKA